MPPTMPVSQGSAALSTPSSTPMPDTDDHGSSITLLNVFGTGGYVLVATALVSVATYLYRALQRKRATGHNTGTPNAIRNVAASTGSPNLICDSNVLSPATSLPLLESSTNPTVDLGHRHLGHISYGKDSANGVKDTMVVLTPVNDIAYGNHYLSESDDDDQRTEWTFDHHPSQCIRGPHDKDHCQCSEEACDSAQGVDDSWLVTTSGSCSPSPSLPLEFHHSLYDPLAPVSPCSRRRGLVDMHCYAKALADAEAHVLDPSDEFEEDVIASRVPVHARRSGQADMSAYAEALATEAHRLTRDPLEILYSRHHKGYSVYAPSETDDPIQVGGRVQSGHQIRDGGITNTEYDQSTWESELDSLYECNIDFSPVIKAEMDLIFHILRGFCDDILQPPGTSSALVSSEDDQDPGREHTNLVLVPSASVSQASLGCTHSNDHFPSIDPPATLAIPTTIDKRSSRPLFSLSNEETPLTRSFASPLRPMLPLVTHKRNKQWTFQPCKQARVLSTPAYQPPGVPIVKKQRGQMFTRRSSESDSADELIDVPLTPPIVPSESVVCSHHLAPAMFSEQREYSPERESDLSLDDVPVSGWVVDCVSKDSEWALSTVQLWPLQYSRC